MRFRQLLFIMLALGLLGGASVAQEKKGKRPKKIDPHWMSYISHKSPKGPWTTDRHDDGKKKGHWKKGWKKGEVYDISVTALRGPSATDVYVSIETDDPAKFPIPEEFEKLQVKILNQKGKVVGVKNFRDVAITDGEAVVSVADLYPPMEITVQANIKIRRKKEEVLRGSATVLFRPDLIVQHVQAPEQVAPNTMFNIQIDVREMKLQSDVTANVSLCEGTEVLSTASGVYVLAGDAVTVNFNLVTFANAGTHDLTIKITDAFPDEYDTGNNEYPFSILVTNPVEPINYTLSYSYENYLISSGKYVTPSGNSDCGETSILTFEGTTTSWNMNTVLPFVTTSPIDSIRWEAVSGNGSLTHGFISEWDLSASYATFDYYDAYIPDDDGSFLYLTVYAYYSGQSTLLLEKTANNFFYVQIVGEDTTTVYEPEHSLQGELVDFLEVRVLFADDGQLAGGSAQVVMAPLEGDSYDNSYPYDDGTCSGQIIDTYNFKSSTASHSGLTEPAVLPTGSVKGTGPTLANIEASSLPQTTDLVQNYPNPFNPSTNIQFTIEHSGPAVLKVYDMLGKEVAELYRGDAEEGRTYRFTFQAANFASGMYYAKLDAGGRHYTKKMLLMK